MTIKTTYITTETDFPFPPVLQSSQRPFSDPQIRKDVTALSSCKGPGHPDRILRVNGSREAEYEET